MNKLLKRTLLVAPVACLSLSLGMFAAACTPDNPDPNPPHTHSYTEWDHDSKQHWKYCLDCPDNATDEKSAHEFSGDDQACECGAKREKTIEMSAGANPVTIDGETTVACIGGYGTYRLTASVNGARSYKFTLGTQEFTIDAAHTSFIFDIEDGEVEVYNPDASDNKIKNVSGVEFKITPAADYSTETAKDSLSLQLDLLSKYLKEGNNSLDVSEPITHIYSKNSNFGEHEFEFDIKDDGEYTVEIFGKNPVTQTVNNTNKKFTVDLRTNNCTLEQTGTGGTSYLFAIKITPKAGSAQNVDFYLLTPQEPIETDYGKEFWISGSKNPAILDKFNGEQEVTINAAADKTDYALVGSAYFGGFTVFVGTEEVGKFEAEEDPSGDNKLEVNIPLTLKPEHFDNGKLVLTFKFQSTSGIHLVAKLTEYVAPVDNTVLQLGEETECSEKDAKGEEENKKYIYTFTAPTAGWYKFTFSGSPKYTFTMEDNDPKAFDFGGASEVVQLAANQTVTVEVSDVPTCGGVLTILVETTEEPPAVKEGDFKLNETFTTTENKMEGVFIAEEQGTYVVTLHDTSGYGLGEYKIGDYKGAYTSELTVVKEVTLAAGEELNIEVYFPEITITVTKK